MRKRVAADLVASPMQLHDGVGADALPMAAPFIDQVARDIERRFCIVLVENRYAGRGGAFGKIIEGETDHRALVTQPERRRAEMPRQAVADACLQRRPSGLRSHFSHPVSGLFLVKGRARVQQENRANSGISRWRQRRCNVFPKGSIWQFGAQCRPAFGLRAHRKGRQLLFGLACRNSRQEGPDSCRVRPRENAICREDIPAPATTPRIPGGPGRR